MHSSLHHHHQHHPTNGNSTQLPSLHHQHHQTHLQMSFTSVSAAYAPHLTSTHPHHHHHLQHQLNQHHPNFHHNPSAVHHPQPLPFAPLGVHHAHHLGSIPSQQRLDHHTKLSAFQFTGCHQGDGHGFKPIGHISNNINNNNNNNTISLNNNNNNSIYNNNNDNHQQDNNNTDSEITVDDNMNDHHNYHLHKHSSRQLSPTSPTHTIRSASSLDRSSGSESPQLIVDNLPSSPISLCNSSTSATDNTTEEKSLSSAQQQSGLLDMLMNPDKCQVWVKSNQGIYNGV